MSLLAVNTGGKKSTGLEDELSSLPEGGPPQPGLKCTGAVEKAQKSPFAAPVLCIKKGIWSVTSAPFIGSKLIQKEQESFTEPVFSQCLRFKVLDSFIGPCWFSHKDFFSGLSTCRRMQRPLFPLAFYRVI